MKRLVKALGASFALVVLILAGGVFYITSVMDPNDYKPRIEQLAFEHAGINLTIEGDISWSLYPWLGMETGSIRLAYPDKPELARLDAAQVSLQLMPLFSGRVEMSDLILEGLSVTLSKDSNDNVNWMTDNNLTQQLSSEASNQSIDTTAETNTRNQGRAAPEIDIASIQLSNARIEYTDLVENTRIELSELSLSSGRIVIDDAIPVEIGFNLRLFDGADTRVEARSQVNTQLTITKDFQTVTLAKLRSKTLLSGSQLPKNLPELSVNSDVILNLSHESLSFNTLTVMLGALKADGNLQVTNFEKPELSGSLQALPFNLKTFMGQLGQTLPKLNDETTLESFSLSTQFQGNLEHIALNPLTLSLDTTQLNGHAAVQLSSGHLTLALKGNTLDVDRYMPNDSQSTSDITSTSPAVAGQSTSTDGGWPRDELFALDPLRALNLSLNLDMEGLTIAQRTLTQPGITLKANNGVINLERLTTQVYSGRISATGNLDARNETAKIQLQTQIVNIQLGQLLKEMADSEVFSGLFNANADITSSGQSIHSMINTLNGQANIEMKEGILEGINMAQTVCQGIQTVTALGVNPRQVDRSTPFADLTGLFRIRNGIVENNDLTALLDAMRLRGQGQVNLPTQSIDYRLGFTLMENLFQQTCSVNNRLEGLELPVDCKGQFDTPPAQMCRPDTSVFTQLLRREVQRKVEERIGGSVEEKIREKIGGEEGARSLIRGLLR